MTPSAGIIADLLVLAHLGFILLVLSGGFLALRHPRFAWLHLPCALWGALVEFAGFPCPLTPLENHFRQVAGESGYQGGFIEHYLVPLIYPEPLPRGLQILFGLIVVAVNLVAYTLLLRRLHLEKNVSIHPLEKL